MPLPKPIRNITDSITKKKQIDVAVVSSTPVESNVVEGKSSTGTRYLQITYMQASLFSLRVSDSTAKVGKSHLCPTPHVIKSALIDKYAQTHSETELRSFLKLIAPLSIYFQLPKDIVVNQGFYTQLKPARDDSATDNAFDTSIMYKEYVQYPTITLFIDLLSMTDAQLSDLILTLSCINYLGKKDALVTYTDHTIVTSLPDKIIRPITLGMGQGMIFALDDFVEYKPNDEVAYLTSLREKGGYGKTAERKMIDYIFPYRLKSTTKKYTCYTLI